MNKDELKKRTKEFALRIIKLVNALPNNPAGRVIGNQLLRAGTSVGANYRAACRAKSKSDFIYKINIVEEEADESAYWLELIVESGLMPNSKIESLLKEANELTAIFVATNKTAKLKR
jgi:four helix bundle protein